MSLEIQWFIYALVENQVLSLEVCQQLYDQLGSNNLGKYAQAVLNELANQLSPEEAQQMLEQFQTVMEFAFNQAQTGQVPDMFRTEEEMEAAWDDIPSLDNVSEMSDQEVAELMMNLLNSLRSLGASDLHISANAKPFIRQNLKVKKFSNNIVPPEDAVRLNTVLLTEDQKTTFENEMDLNFALEIGENRFRASLMVHKDGCSGSYRLVPDRIKSLAELGYMPEDVKTVERMLDYHNGLILVTGPLGSGKTTTLAAMVDVLNQKRYDHVITVEDPIEILQTSQNCNVTQRQVGAHTKSYSAALKGALREDPDIIVIGELHDLETIENAITASETGHLVIGTLHTCDAGNTLNRMLDVFPPTQQPQIRAMTAGSLRGIVCQRLIPGKNDKLALGYEILVNTMAVSNTISQGKTHMLSAVMQTGTKQGMCTFDNCLLKKYKIGEISPEVAEDYMTDQSTLKLLRDEIAINGAKELASKNVKTK